MDKPEYKTKIKIEGDTKGAEGAIARTSGALRGLLKPLTAIRSAIAMVSRAMGTFYLAAEGVRVAANLFRKLDEWIGKAARSARELADRIEQSRMEGAAARAVIEYKKLNEALAEGNRLERERNEILDRRVSTSRGIEDARLELDKQLEIGRLDPASKTYAEDKAAIERKYARESAANVSERASEDVRARLERSATEANAKDVAANQIDMLVNRLYERQSELSGRANIISQTRPGDADAQKMVESLNRMAEELSKQIGEALKNRDALRQEADSIRRKSAEEVGANTAAKMRYSARMEEIATGEREAEARKAEEEAKKRREAEARENSAKSEIAMQAEIAGLDPSKKGFADAKAAIERTYRRRELEAKRDAATRDVDKLEAEAALAKLDNEERVANAKMKDPVTRENVTLSAGSRLNAMGLGSGSGVQRIQEQMATSLKDMVRFAREQLNTLKDIRNNETGAVFQ